MFRAISRCSEHDIKVRSLISRCSEHDIKVLSLISRCSEYDIKVRSLISYGASEPYQGAEPDINVFRAISRCSEPDIYQGAQSMISRCSEHDIKVLSLISRCSEPDIKVLRAISRCSKPYFPKVFGQTGLSIQCRIRSDATEHSTVCHSVTYPAVFGHISRKVHLLKI